MRRGHPPVAGQLTFNVAVFCATTSPAVNAPAYHPDMTNEPEKPGTETSIWTKLRRGCAGVLVLLALAAAVLSSWTPWLSSWQVCQQEVVTIGDSPVAEVCRPLAVTDAPVLLVVLLSLLLLLPDLKTFKIAGLVEIERHIMEAREEVKDVARQITTLTANSAANAHNEVNFNIDHRTLSQSGQELDAQAEKVVEEPIPPVAPAERPNSDPDHLSLLLISLAEDLEGIRRRALGTSRGQRRPEWAWNVDDFGRGDLREHLERWLTVFDDEYEAVRAVRNRVAHDLPVEPEELSRAVNIAGRLWNYAYLSMPHKGDVRVADPRVAEALTLG